MSYTSKLHKCVIAVTSKMALACALIFLVSGCSLLGDIKFPKTDLDAFLDGDQIEKESTAELEEELAPVSVVVTTDEGQPKPVENVITEQCSPDVDTKYAYRRRIALLAFDIANRRDAVDFPHIERRYPQLLASTIDSERFIVKDATHLRLLNNVDMRNGYWVEPKADQIMSLAKTLGVQFIVSGSLDDLSVDTRDQVHLLNFVDLLRENTSLSRKKLMGKQPRRFTVSLNIYDGGTGVLIKRQTFSDEGHFDADIQRHQKLLTSSFLKTAYGELMKGVVTAQANSFLASLDCIPMQAKVIRATDNGLLFDAGVESLVIPGDRLQVFRRVSIGSDNSNRYRLENYGSISVSRSNPLVAEGIFEEGDMASGIRPGDIVQAW